MELYKDYDNIIFKPNAELKSRLIFRGFTLYKNVIKQKSIVEYWLVYVTNKFYFSPLSNDI